MNASAEPEPGSPAPTSSGTTWLARTSRASRVRIALLAVVLLAVVAGLAVARLQLLDPYRSGTVHHETTQLNGCDIPGGLYLDGRVWQSHDRLPDTWPASSDMAHDIGGTLEVTATDEATFTADIGGSVHYHRLAPNALGDLDCPIK